MHLLRQAPGAGFTSAMFDAGALPYEDNVAATRAAVDWGHGAGLWLGAGLGYVGGHPGAAAGARVRGADGGAGVGRGRGQRARHDLAVGGPGPLADRPAARGRAGPA